MRYHKGFKFGDRIIWPPYGAERCTCPQAVKAYEEEKAAKAAEEEANRKAEAERKMRERINRIIGESGMGDRFLRRHLRHLPDSPTTTGAQPQRPAGTPTASTPLLAPARGSPSPAATAYSSQARRAPARTHLAAAIAPTT